MLSWYANPLKRCQWRWPMGLDANVRATNSPATIWREFGVRNALRRFPGFHRRIRESMSTHQHQRYYRVDNRAKKPHLSSTEGGNLGDQSAHVARLFAAHQYDKILQYWTELYETSHGFINFYVAVTAIRAARAMKDLARSAEIARKLFDSMLSYPNIEAYDFELHSATIVLAFMHAPDRKGQENVLEMISQLAARNFPVVIPATVLIKDMTKHGQAHQSIAAIKLLKKLADKYPEIKRADFHLIDLLVSLFAKNQIKATQHLLALLTEWQVEFGPKSLLLLVQAGLKRKFPNESLHDHYLPLFNDFSADHLSNDMVLDVAKLIRQQQWTDMLQLPLKMRQKIQSKNRQILENFGVSGTDQKMTKINPKRVEKIEREETSWVAYQMHYHLIAIACEVANYDVAIHSYIESLRCSTGKSQEFNTIVAFFTLPHHHAGMDFALNHILSDSNYTFSDGTTEFIPMWDPETSLNPNNALLLFNKLIHYKMCDAALKVLPVIYANQDLVRWEPLHVKSVIQNILDVSDLQSTRLNTILRSPPEIWQLSSLPPEIEAIIFIEIEKILLEMVLISYPRFEPSHFHSVK